MWKLLLICAVMAASNTEAAKSHRKRYAGAGSSAGSYAGTGAYAGTGGFAGGYTGGYNGGYNGGYAGGYDDEGDYYDGGYYAPNFGPGFIDPYLFHQQLTAQILAQHAAQNHALASTYSTGDASVHAGASSARDDDDYIQHQIAQQHAYNNRHNNLYNRNGNGNKGHRYAPNFAAASGSVGPGGYHQTALISPENTNSPNVVNRFSTSTGPGGYKGVSVSSFSSSSDVNGKRTNQRGAQTTVNDNGKITSYSVHS